MAKRKAVKKKTTPIMLFGSAPEILPVSPPENVGESEGTVQAAEREAEEVSAGSTSVGLLFFPREDWERDWRDPRVRVLRQDESTQKWALHGTLAWDEAGQDKVTELFGGGRWLVQLIGADERGVSGIRKSQVHRLPGRYKPPTSVPNTATTAAAGQPAQRVGVIGDGGDGSVSPSQALNVALVDSVIGLMKAMKETPTRTPAMDWGPILASTMPVLTAIVTKIMDGPKRDDTLLHQLQAMQDEIVKMRDRPGPAANAITDALAGIERIVKVSSSIRDMSATPEGETSIWGALGKEALSLLANAQRNQQQGQSVTRQDPAVGMIAPPSPTPTGGAPTMPLWQQLLLSQRTRLLDAASRGLDPELVADFAVQFLPEQHVGVMTEFLQRPDATTVLQQVIPELTNFPTWCEKLITAMRAGMFGADDAGGEGEVTG